jgi:hypothetical protein
MSTSKVILILLALAVWVVGFAASLAVVGAAPTAIQEISGILIGGFALVEKNIAFLTNPEIAAADITTVDKVLKQGWIVD